MKLIGPGTRVSHGWVGTAFNSILQSNKEPVLRRNSINQREQELGLQRTGKDLSISYSQSCVLSLSLSHTHTHTYTHTHTHTTR